MKKPQSIHSIIIYSILLIFIPFSIQSQSGNSPLRLFKTDEAQLTKWRALRSNKNVTIIEYDSDAFQKLKAANLSELDIIVPIPDGEIKLELVQNRVITEDFILKTDKSNHIPFDPGLYYRGNIAGQPNSVVAISFFENEVIAVINSEKGESFVIGQSPSLRSNSFVVFDGAKEKSPGFDCMANDDIPAWTKEINKIQPKIEQRSQAGCVRVYYECGLSVYQNKGGTTGAADYITGVFNVISTLYSRESITTVISEILVWTTTEPYSATANAALTSFGARIKNTFNGDLAQLVRLKSSGSFSGIAWVDVLCLGYQASSNAGRYSYAEIMPTYSAFPTYHWTSEVMTHEMGHNLGSPHTHSCQWPGGPIDNCRAQEGSCAPGPTPSNGGTIMSYCHLTSIGINYNNGFGPQPGNLIRSRVNAATCLTTCGSSSSCNTAPSSLTSGNINTTSVTLSWASVVGANNYTIEYKTAAASNYIVAASASTSTTFNLAGLLATTAYNWRVKANCSSGTSSAYTLANFTTAATTTCATPSNLNTTAIGTSSATLSWAAASGSTGYTVEYKTSAAASWTLLSTTTASVTTLNLTGLAAATAYLWRVRTNCASGSSAYTQASFTTASTPCSTAPSGLATASITTSTASASWTAVANAINYTVEYKLSSAATWTPGGTVTATSFAISGLTANTAYNWHVRANCSSGSTAYSQANFSTAAVGCATAPSGLSNTNITTSSATLSWATVSGAVNYTVQYKLSSSATWITHSTVAVLTINLSGLTGASLYNWQVRANCSSTSSAYTQASFSTASASTCPGTYDVSTNGSTSGSAQIPLNIDIKGLISSSTDNDYYKFIITTAGTLAITLGTLPNDYDLRVYSSSLASVGISQLGGTNSETLNLNLAAGTYYARVYGYSGANNASVCYTLRVQTGTATLENEISVTDLVSEIYPNPAKKILNINIKGLKQKASLLVVDLNGRQLIQKDTYSETNQIDVSNLAAGFYFIKIKEDDRRNIIKFMKQ